MLQFSNFFPLTLLKVTEDVKKKKPVWVLSYWYLPCVCVCVCVCVSRSVMSNSLWPHGLWPAKLLCSWNFSGRNTGNYCHFLLQGIFLTQESNPALLLWRKSALKNLWQILYHLSYQWTEKILEHNNMEAHVRVAVNTISRAM